MELSVSSLVAGELRKMQLRLRRAILCLSLCPWWCSGSGLSSLRPDVIEPDEDVASQCQHLAADLGRKLVRNLTTSKPSNEMTCSATLSSSTTSATQKGAIRLKARKTTEDPLCSPVCAMQLDAVVVLSPSGGAITDASMARSKNHLEMLLEHFELGSKSGSLFGFVDISRGIDNPQVVKKLSGTRSTLNEAVSAWAPKLGGSTVSEAELQDIESKPVMLDMLKDSRPDIKRTLLVLDVSPPSSNKGNQNATEVPILVSMNGGNLVRMPISMSGHGDDLKYQVVETLVAVCPAIVIDPTMKCGRLRWGKGESADPQAL